MATSRTDMFWGEMAPTEHFVQFYEDDSVLLDTLEGFIGGGLRSGEGAIVIATPEHLDGLERRLEAAGINLPDALARDQYVPLDAEQTLARFMNEDWPDETLFSSVITEILNRARGRSRRVRAFGEMVALLWERGQVAATVRLEHLWSKLCHTAGFSLFCAYPNVGLTRDATHSISEICATHSRIISGL